MSTDRRTGSLMTFLLTNTDPSSMGMSVSCLDIVDTFVSNPSDGLDGGCGVVRAQLLIDEGSSVTIISLDLCTQLLANVRHFFHGQALPIPYGVGMPVNAHVIEHGVGDAVEELDNFFAVEDSGNRRHASVWYVGEREDIPRLSFVLAIGAHTYTWILRMQDTGTSSTSTPALDDVLSIYDVTLPLVVRR